MFDDEVMQEVQEVVEQVEQPEETQEVEQVVTKPKKDPSESFREVRMRAERAERERAELERRLAELESAHTHEPEEDLEINLGEDDLAEGKHLKKVDKKLKKMQQELQRYKEIAENNSVEVQLKRKFSDFDDVVSADNVKRLKDEYPEMFDTITEGRDMYKKGVTAYNMIKRLGIVEAETFKEERQIAERNLAKPRPLVSGAAQSGNTPLSKANAFANGLTPELQKQLWAEMQELRKRS